MANLCIWIEFNLFMKKESFDPKFINITYMGKNSKNILRLKIQIYQKCWDWSKTMVFFINKLNVYPFSLIVYNAKTVPKFAPNTRSSCRQLGTCLDPHILNAKPWRFPCPQSSATGVPIQCPLYWQPGGPLQTACICTRAQVLRMTGSIASNPRAIGTLQWVNGPILQFGGQMGSRKSRRPVKEFKTCLFYAMICGVGEKRHYQFLNRSHFGKSIHLYIVYFCDIFLH